MYAKTVFKKFNIEMKKGWRFFALGMLLESIAIMLSDDANTPFWGNAMIFILYVSMLIYINYNQKKWNFGKYLSSFFMACFDGIGGVTEFFTDLVVAIKENKNQKTKTGLYCLLGVVIFIPVALVIVPLLASADAVFEKMVNDFFKNLFSVEYMVLIPLFFVCIYLFSYGTMKSLGTRNLKKK